MSENESAMAELELRIRRTIPLSAAMEFSIETLTEELIETRAPLPPNVNIHGSGFAGSIYSLAVLTGWAYCVYLLESEAVDAELVVASADIRYRRPVTADITCVSSATPGERREFIDALRSQGKQNLQLEVRVGDPPCALLTARYHAIARL